MRTQDEDGYWEAEVERLHGLLHEHKVELVRLDRIEEAATWVSTSERLPGEVWIDWARRIQDALRAALGEEDVPRVTDAERAEALRVREVIAEDNSPR